MGKFDDKFDWLTEGRWAYAVLVGLVFADPAGVCPAVLDRDEGRFTEACPR
jgi:hypothetical protein